MRPAGWPRYMIDKRLKNGDVAYYWNTPSRDIKAGFPLPRATLGTDYGLACQQANDLNRTLDDWRLGKDTSPDERHDARYGTVGWWIKMYLRDPAFKNKVSKRAQPDYRSNLYAIADLERKDRPGTLGSMSVSTITPEAAQKVYQRLVDGGRGERYRTAQYATDVAKKAWDVVSKKYPAQFQRPHFGIDNPFVGLVRVTTKGTKPAATREQVYKFASAAREAGHPSLGLAAIVCFEWLQRPENMLAGHLTWNDYRPKDHPHSIRIFHHKTNQQVWHPLQDADGIRYYPEAEAYISAHKRLGVIMALRDDLGDIPQKYEHKNAAKWVRTIRRKIGLPETFTLDACRHGGMTELEEAGLTTGQGMVLSAHRTTKAYRGYAKDTDERVLAATRKRRAWVENG